MRAYPIRSRPNEEIDLRTEGCIYTLVRRTRVGIHYDYTTIMLNGREATLLHEALEDALSNKKEDKVGSISG